MADIALRQYPVELHGVTMDWLMTDLHMLDETEELATAVRVALGTDRLADVNEVLPDPDSTDRRGWWGDIDAEDIWDGWQIGCKNWLLSRAKISDDLSWEGATLQRAHAYTYEALRPFIDRRIASDIYVNAIRKGKSEIDVFVIMYRGPLKAIELRFAYLWDQVIDQ
jgi:phage gp46-like protein